MNMTVFKHTVLSGARLNEVLNRKTGFVVRSFLTDVVHSEQNEESKYREDVFHQKTFANGFS